MGFKYQRRSAEDYEKRATQQGGDFESFIRDEITLFSPKKGDNWIRILPPTWDGARHFAYDVTIHYSVGPEKATIVCPAKQFKKPCPVCDAQFRLEKQGDTEGAKELRASRRCCVWVVDMKDQDKGPMIWPMPWTADRDLSKMTRDRRSGEIFHIDDPDEGYDITFEKEGEKMQTKYVAWRIAQRPTSIPNKWLDVVEDNPIPDCLINRSTQIIRDLFTGGMGAEEEETAAKASPGRESRDRRDRERDEREPASSASAERSRGNRESEREPQEDERRSDRRPRDEETSRRSRDDREPEPETRASRRRVEPPEDETPPPRTRRRLEVPEDDEPTPEEAARDGRRAREDREERGGGSVARDRERDRDRGRDEWSSTRLSPRDEVDEDEIPFDKGRKADEGPSGGTKDRAAIYRERLLARRGGK